MIHPWITVLTTPARPEYLLGTLASIHAAGGHRFVGNRVVFVDGDVNAAPAVPGGWVKLTAGAVPRGSRRSMWKILNMAAVARAPYLLYFEDDVRLCRNAIAAMSAIAVPPGVAFLTFLNQYEALPDRAGVHCRRAGDPTVGHGFWGSQALKIPLRSLRLFERRHTQPKDQWAYAADEWLGQQLATREAFGIVHPSLVRHIGERTTIPSQQGQTLAGHRAGLGYPGDEFDAGTLPANLPLFDL